LAVVGAFALYQGEKKMEKNKLQEQLTELVGRSAGMLVGRQVMRMRAKKAPLTREELAEENERLKEQAGWRVESAVSIMHHLEFLLSEETFLDPPVWKGLAAQLLRDMEDLTQ